MTAPETEAQKNLMAKKILSAEKQENLTTGMRQRKTAASRRQSLRMEAILVAAAKQRQAKRTAKARQP
jgi:hypothetical protein